ncbi:hypothetical protein ACG74X_12495 [Marivita sp. S0852]|uniref:hypothetical protein n=1 Tax=Marivita sp. S0852 TaxID=3373893 RepID=UPI003981B569
MVQHVLKQRIAGGIGIVFGALTILSGGRALLGDADMGQVVPFVLWFNTLAGFAYVVAGLGLWTARWWAFRLSLGIFLATVLVFAGFGFHVATGGLYETRTVFAMTLRSAVWAALTLTAWQLRSS